VVSTPRRRAQALAGVLAVAAAAAAANLVVRAQRPAIADEPNPAGYSLRIPSGWQVQPEGAYSTVPVAWWA
jgi:hypothetical protein